VKTTADPERADWLRAEHRAYSGLRRDFLPKLLGWEDGPLPLLVLEDLSKESHWPPPWSEADIAAVVSALGEIAGTPPPDGLKRLESNDVSGWKEIARDPDPFLGRQPSRRARVLAPKPRT